MLTAAAHDAKRRTGDLSSVSAIAHDLMVMLASKHERIAAMEACRQDADGSDAASLRALCQRIEMRDRQDIAELRAHLFAHVRHLQA